MRSSKIIFNPLAWIIAYSAVIKQKISEYGKKGGGSEIGAPESMKRSFLTKIVTKIISRTYGKLRVDRVSRASKLSQLLRTNTRKKSLSQTIYLLII